MAGRGQHLVPQARHRRLGAERPARGLLPPAGPRLHAAAGLRQHEGLHSQHHPHAVRRPPPGGPLGAGLFRRMADRGGRRGCAGPVHPDQRSAGYADVSVPGQRPDPGGAQRAGHGPLAGRGGRPRAGAHQPGGTRASPGPANDSGAQPEQRPAASGGAATGSGRKRSDRWPRGGRCPDRAEPQHGVGQWAVLPGHADLPGRGRLHLLPVAGQ